MCESRYFDQLLRTSWDVFASFALVNKATASPPPSPPLLSRVSVTFPAPVERENKEGSTPQGNVLLCACVVGVRCMWCVECFESARGVVCCCVESCSCSLCLMVVND